MTVDSESWTMSWPIFLHKIEFLNVKMDQVEERAWCTNIFKHFFSLNPSHVHLYDEINIAGMTLDLTFPVSISADVSNPWIKAAAHSFLFLQVRFSPVFTGNKWICSYQFEIVRYMALNNTFKARTSASEFPWHLAYTHALSTPSTRSSRMDKNPSAAQEERDKKEKIHVTNYTNK